MAILGQLKNFNLASLIESTCLETRPARITIQSDWQVGDVYVADGKVVHATVGNVRGEQAIYEMLTWRHGTFRLAGDQSAPQTSIILPWDRLLAGYYEIEEKEQQLKGDMPSKQVTHPLSPEVQAQDAFLETNLLLTFSDLEQNLVNIFKSTPAKQPLRAFVFLANAINRMLDLMLTHPRGATMSAKLIKNLVNGTTLQTESCRLLDIRDHKLQVETVKEVYQSWTGDLQERQAIFTGITDHLYWVLSAVSTATIDLIQTPVIRQDSWETCEAFLQQVSESIGQMDF